MHQFKHICYADLNARQQEAYNYQKVSAVLADFGFATMRLSDDWRGADFIAQHIDGVTFLRVQLKGRLTFDKKYLGRDIHICFPCGGGWFMCPHDGLLASVLAVNDFSKTAAWANFGGYSFPKLSKKLRKLVEPYLLRP